MKILPVVWLLHISHAPHPISLDLNHALEGLYGHLHECVDLAHHDMILTAPILKDHTLPVLGMCDLLGKYDPSLHIWFAEWSYQEQFDKHHLRDKLALTWPMNRSLLWVQFQTSDPREPGSNNHSCEDSINHLHKSTNLPNYTKMNIWTWQRCTIDCCYVITHC